MCIFGEIGSICITLRNSGEQQQNNFREHMEIAEGKCGKFKHY